MDIEFMNNIPKQSENNLISVKNKVTRQKIDAILRTYSGTGESDFKRPPEDRDDRNPGRKCVQKSMDNRSRNVFIYKFYFERSDKEIAALLRIPVDSVHYHLIDAIKFLEGNNLLKD